MAATALPWQPILPSKLRRRTLPVRPPVVSVRAFRRRDIDDFTQRLASGEAWRDAWRSANDGFERLLFEAQKTAERIDRRYAVKQRLSSVSRSAVERARELDREFEIGMRWRTFTMDFSRNWPRYRMQLNKFLESPLGKSSATIFFLWFALSGWLFRILIIATWVLPFAGPLLIGTLANNLVIKGTCPACKMQFAGYKNQIIRCTSCGNIVWQPKGDFYSKEGRSSSSSKSEPEIIDVDFEEK
ncbi:replicase polyprotein 1ab protein [Senna tora]|uniref:Replicase polyprotein 1ab protein n=1 Tax=Senna tora TaxID=362788 RepID=A0A834X2H1_9FABA|nr:replicase polyprotein 1ab protein [Senna tora]